MDLFSPLRLGVHVATDAVKLATAVPRLILHQLQSGNGDGEQTFSPTDDAPVGRPDRGGTPTAAPEPSGPARGGTGRRAPSPRATPGRATTADDGVEQTAGPAEPTSAAGASAGIAGTAAAPGDAAVAGAPDPTASAAAPQGRSVPQGERRETDVRPPARARRRQQTTPKRSEIDQRRERDREREFDAADAVESEGAADPGATIRVDAPWPGYEKMRAPEIVGRVAESDAATKAVVRLYEQTHKKRKSIIDATGS